MMYFRKYAQQDVIDEWQNMSLEKVRSEKIPMPESSIFFLEQGAKCKYCDWQLPIGQVPFYSMQLPDTQQCRSYGRILAVKARIEIANGKFDDAIHTFQTTYALGRNVAQGETLINGLVGMAIGSLMFPQICEYVQQPQAPNLYWALTVLPSPMITLGNALDVESHALELSFPDFRDVETAKRSPEEWRNLFHQLAKQIIELTATGKPQVPQPMSVEELDKLCSETFPVAKRRLIATGMAKETVEAMSVHQVALVYTKRVSRELFEDAVKYYSLPYPEAMQGMNAAFDRAKASKESGEAIPLADQTLMVLQSTRTGLARSDRRIAILRMFEALRIYAAAHDGSLPLSLSDITEVPLPVDPVTNKLFEYHRDGNKATVRGATSGDVPANYEITMAAVK
jgi:hypothetical protein